MIAVEFLSKYENGYVFSEKDLRELYWQGILGTYIGNFVHRDDNGDVYHQIYRVNKRYIALRMRTVYVEAEDDPRCYEKQMVFDLQPIDFELDKIGGKFRNGL